MPELSRIPLQLRNGLIGSAVAIVVLAGAYAWGRSDGRALEQAAQSRETLAAVRTFEDMQRAIAGELAKIEIRNTTIRAVVEREIHEVPVYRDCKHSDSGLRAVNAALSNGAAAPGDGELPAADAAR